ncbi:MAG: DsrE family protein [gamma proteobacterium endosymbiont of Lamellibrachia anaximandri]|nr:DsrE family protein [gamma proteobacterium endosymbiont of Lamellibrachia anaximandri]MBL3534355.1 DsrE family protein [gamma proteobacterium endosymbiont of Lamellibrachia anaximandri]
MNILIILNDPPYGTERSYNGLRLAKALSKTDTNVTAFLMADAVVCAKRGQKVPQGFYNIELMLKSVTRKGEVLLCGTCMDARGFTDDEIVQDAQRSTMAELAERTLSADKVLVF